MMMKRNNDFVNILSATVLHTVKPERTSPAKKPSDTAQSSLFAHKNPFGLGGSGFFTCIVSLARVVAGGDRSTGIYEIRYQLSFLLDFRPLFSSASMPLNMHVREFKA